MAAGILTGVSPFAIVAAVTGNISALSISNATSVDIPAHVTAIEYDPNRTARLALLAYADGEKRYIVAPLGLKVGDTILTGAQAEIRVGNNLPLANIPVGTLIHNVELKEGKGGQLVRAAGGAAQLLAKEGDYAQVRLPSGEVRLVRQAAMPPSGRSAMWITAI